MSILIRRASARVKKAEKQHEKDRARVLARSLVLCRARAESVLNESKREKPSKGAGK